jgi:hypothetical protein
MGNQMYKPKKPDHSLTHYVEELPKNEISKVSKSGREKNNKYNLMNPDVLNDLDSIFMIP